MGRGRRLFPSPYIYTALHLLKLLIKFCQKLFVPAFVKNILTESDVYGKIMKLYWDIAKR